MSVHNVPRSLRKTFCYCLDDLNGRKENAFERAYQRFNKIMIEKMEKYSWWTLNTPISEQDPFGTLDERYFLCFLYAFTNERDPLGKLLFKQFKTIPSFNDPNSDKSISDIIKTCNNKILKKQIFWIQKIYNLWFIIIQKVVNNIKTNVKKSFTMNEMKDGILRAYHVSSDNAFHNASRKVKEYFDCMFEKLVVEKLTL